MELLETRDDLLGKLRAYADVPDDDVIRFKKKIKDALLRCPELLYALDNKELEGELFTKDGKLNAHYEDGVLVPDGEWDRYFGYNIRDYIFIEQVQTNTDNFLCYTVSWSEVPKYNDYVYYAEILFTALCSSVGGRIHDPLTGLSRHDLIGSIIRERFNWSNIFGTQCHLVSNMEKIYDSKYIGRQVVFECVLPNAVAVTPYKGKTGVVNYMARR